MNFFSVVIPLYNKEKYVSRAIFSVLNQSFQDFEILIVDDGSTDKSYEVVSQFSDNRIRLISQSNSGVSVARNTAIKNSNGEYIAFLDADDEWKSDFLERINNLIIKFPSAGIYSTSYAEIDDNGSLRKRSFCDLPITSVGILDYFRSATYGDQPVWTSATCISKNVFYDVGFFPENEKFGEDLDMWARIAIKYDVAFDKKVCSFYYKDISTIRVYETLPFWNTFDRLLKLDLIPISKIDQIREYIFYQKIKISRNLILNQRKGIAFKILKNVKTKKFIKFKYWWMFWSLMPDDIIKISANVKRMISHKNVS